MMTSVDKYTAYRIMQKTNAYTIKNKTIKTDDGFIYFPYENTMVYVKYNTHKIDRNTTCKYPCTMYPKRSILRPKVSTLESQK